MGQQTSYPKSVTISCKECNLSFTSLMWEKGLQQNYCDKCFSEKFTSVSDKLQRQLMTECKGCHTTFLAIHSTSIKGTHVEEFCEKCRGEGDISAAAEMIRARLERKK